MGSSICDVRRLVLAVALGSVLGARPATVRAQGGDEPTAKRAAEAKLQEGVTLLKERRFGDALARFKEAYALVPSPLILYDFGLAQLGMGDDPAALESFQDFLRSAPEAPADKRRKASGYSDDLRKRVAVVTVKADVAAGSLRVDGRDLGRVALPRDVYLAPGLHEVTVRAGNVTQGRAVTCAAGDAQTISVALSEPPREPAVPATPPPAAALLARPPPPAAAEPTAPAAHHSGARSWALATAAAGAASIGAGLTFGLLASSQAGDVTADSQNRRVFVPASESSGLRDQRFEIVFLSVGAAAVLTGLGIYAFVRHREAGGVSWGAP